MEEWTKYKTAALKIHSLGLFENFSRKHEFFESYAHDTPRFLPWHRLFLAEYESYIIHITGDPTFGVPYWDWTLDASSPADSFIFTEAYWGFKNCFPVNYPTLHCLKREEMMEPWSNPYDINKILKRRCSYDEFRFILEMVPHGLVHANIGGDMAQMHSPNDPVFWHHHSYMDYLWTKRGENYNGMSYDGKTKIKKEEVLLPFNIKVKDVLKQRNVKYKEYRPVKAANFVKASKLPIEYIKMHKFNEEKIRKVENMLSKDSIWSRLLNY